MEPRRYLISALRSDGLHCSGTVEVSPNQVRRVLKLTFRTFTARGAVVCPNPKHNGNRCFEHVGETFTFSGHDFQEER